MTNKKYTNEQISKSISYWSNYLIESNMATREEVEKLIGEGLLKNIKTKIHDFFAPNDGVKKMLTAMASASKSGEELENIKIYANLGGKGKTAPVVGFALVNNKHTLLLIVDQLNLRSKPKTLRDLRYFLVEDQNIKSVKSTINSIKCAKLNAKLAESIIVESKLTDYLDNAKLSKDDAIKLAKEISRRITKKGEAKTVAAIEKYFEQKAKVDNPTSDGSSKDAKEDAKEDAKDSSTDSNKDDLLPEPDSNKEDTKEDTKEDGKEDMPDFTDDSPKAEPIECFDNELLDVKYQKKCLGFIFSKSSEEIKLDKKYIKALKI